MARIPKRKLIKSPNKFLIPIPVN